MRDNDKTFPFWLAVMLIGLLALSTGLTFLFGANAPSYAKWFTIAGPILAATGAIMLVTRQTES